LPCGDDHTPPRLFQISPGRAALAAIPGVMPVFGSLWRRMTGRALAVVGPTN
jgi:hypothetical protein